MAARGLHGTTTSGDTHNFSGNPPIVVLVVNLSETATLMVNVPACHGAGFYLPIAPLSERPYRSDSKAIDQVNVKGVSNVACEFVIDPVVSNEKPA